jgi:hypothetical protein
MCETATGSIYAMRLRDIFDRVRFCKARYWKIPKDDRIECGLRPDLVGGNYSGTMVIDLCNDLLIRAFRGVDPFQSESLKSLILFHGNNFFESPKDVVDFVDEKISELETKLDNYERGQRDA